MVRRCIKSVLFQSPLLLSWGGASIAWLHVQQHQLSFLHVPESFILVWLGYRILQKNAHRLFRSELAFFLTVLMLLCALLGYPLSLLVAGLVVYFYGFNPKFSLRKIPLVKNAAIALAWTCCTTALVYAPTEEFATAYIADFLLVFGLSILSDVRDREQDREQLQTLVQQIGTWPTSAIGGLAVLCYPCLHFQVLPYSNMPWLLLVFIAAYVIALIWMSMSLAHRWATVAIDFGLTVLPLIVALA